MFYGLKRVVLWEEKGGSMGKKRMFYGLKEGSLRDRTLDEKGCFVRNKNVWLIG